MPRKPNYKKFEQILAMINKGHSYTEIQSYCSCSPSTISKAKKWDLEGRRIPSTTTTTTTTTKKSKQVPVFHRTDKTVSLYDAFGIWEVNDSGKLNLLKFLYCFFTGNSSTNKTKNQMIKELIS